MSERDVTLRDGRTLQVYEEGDPDGVVVVGHHGTLRAGRTLHVYDEGDPDGVVVVEHHGTPGSGLSYPPDVEPARERGLRLIGYDRAGYGGSTSRAGREVADIANDIEDVL